MAPRDSSPLGARLYRIARRRWVVASSFAIALIACLSTLYRVSLLPPGLHSRPVSLGAASTTVLVASPNLIVSGSSTQYASLVNRAILLGNVMISPPVLNGIARAVGVPEGRIQASAPMSANVPRALIDPGSGGNATDILASPDQYKLEIQADPSVPVLHVYAQAPSAKRAITLANTAVRAATSYLQQLQSAGRIPPSQWVQMEQLGAARGGVANPGGPTEMAILVFVGVFGVMVWLLSLAARIHGGWVTARLVDQPQT